jgi:hypothetical protein
MFSGKGGVEGVGGVESPLLKVAVQVVFAVKAIPLLHPDDQPAKVEPALAVAPKVTGVPAA